MATNNPQSDWRSETFFTPEQQHFFNRIVLAIVLVGLGIWIGSLIFSGDESSGYATNIYTEILSVAVTVGILDYLNRRRDEQSRVKELKARLVREAGGQSNEAAKRAVDELRANGWLIGEDSLIKGAHMEGANLQEVNLKDANLQKANLKDANLQRANLEGTTLQGANLFAANLQGARLEFVNLEGARLEFVNLDDAWSPFAHLEGANLGRASLKAALLTGISLKGANLLGANLENAHLRFANLAGANLQSANLQGAILYDAKLEGSNLSGANLEGAKIQNTKFDESITLPDNTKWSLETDLTDFTDPI